MLVKYAPKMVIITAFFVGNFTSNTVALAQLPPTNMGKFVHQPGDNQYTPQTQMERHGVSAAPTSGKVHYNSTGGNWTPTPPPARPDISLDPIASDEPVPPAGFPPLPDRLDLPIASASVWKNAHGAGSSTSTSSEPPAPTFHQHYAHLPPGAFLNQEQLKHGSDSGYYKVKTPNVDYYSGGKTVGSRPAYSGASAKDLRALGQEPKLNDQNNQASAPDAPQAVTVNQAATQDLSLPEDEFSYQASHPSRTRGIMRGITNRLILMPFYYGLGGLGGMGGGRW